MYKRQVGVSFNKIFAKLGSGMKKPDAVTVIPADSFREKGWPLPVGDLLFVGPATRRKLADMNVRTIGDLAWFDAECLRGRLGKPGLVLKAYAAGLDLSLIHISLPAVFCLAFPTPPRTTHLAARRMRQARKRTA